MARKRTDTDIETRSGGNVIPDRRQEIVRAAEKLFSMRSYEAVSIRDIAGAADVNSALIRYYFGSKEDLYRALFESRYHTITSARVRKLENLEIQAGSMESLRAIVSIWTAPLLELLSDPESKDFILVMARESMNISTDEHGIFETYLDPSARRCIAALQLVAPAATRADVVQAYLWMVAVVMSSVTGSARSRRLSDSGGHSLKHLRQHASKLETFVACGIQALFQEG